MVITADEYYKLKTTLRSLSQLEKERELHKKQEEVLKAMLKNIQATCPHAWEYIPDASGNNDSYHSCLICGATR